MKVHVKYEILIEVWDSEVYCLVTIISDGDPTMKTKLKNHSKN